MPRESDAAGEDRATGEKPVPKSYVMRLTSTSESVTNAGTATRLGKGRSPASTHPSAPTAVTILIGTVPKLASCTGPAAFRCTVACTRKVARHEVLCRKATSGYAATTDPS